jgi:hypothetical protein
VPRVFLRTKLIPELESLIQSESCNVQLDGYDLENRAEIRDEKIKSIIRQWEELELLIPPPRYDRKEETEDKQELYDLIKLIGGRF